MNNGKSLDRLTKVGLGDKFEANGMPFLVSEVVSCLDYPDRWFDYVHYLPDGLEFVLEREGSKLSLWKQVVDVELGRRKKSIQYRGEMYKFDEEESGVAETILRKMENGKEITKVAKTPYDIFIAPSGTSLCREIWDGKECWYFSEPGPIEISF